MKYKFYDLGRHNIGFISFLFFARQILFFPKLNLLLRLIKQLKIIIHYVSCNFIFMPIANNYFITIKIAYINKNINFKFYSKEILTF